MTGIVILIYKSHERILTYLREEIPKISSPHRTLVLDAGSPLEHAQCLGKALGIPVYQASDDVQDAPLFLLHTPENLGYARGNNLATRFLLRNFPDTDKILFSNDDIELITPDAVGILERCLDAHPDAGCAGPCVIDLQGNCHGPEYRLPSIWRQILRNLGEPLFGAARFQESAPAERKSTYCRMVEGCFLLVRASSFSQIGMFDERTFLYWEERILAARLARIGQRIYYEHSARIRHFVGNTTTGKASMLLLLRCTLDGEKLYFREYAKSSLLSRSLLWLSARIRLALVTLAYWRRCLIGK